MEVVNIEEPGYDRRVTLRSLETYGGQPPADATIEDISGRVVFTGTLPHVGQVFLVDLASAGDRRGRFARWVLTDGSTGAFEFKHVAPGKYVLGFELGHSPTLGVPYASRYLPSGTDESKATVFEVTAGQEIKDVEFNPGSEVGRKHVHVRVTWEDGSPAVNGTAYLRDAHNPDSSVADEQTPTDSNGKAILEGFVDTGYDVDANAVCKGRSASKQIKKKIIPASSADAFVELTVKGRKCSLVVERYALEIE